MELGGVAEECLLKQKGREGRVSRLGNRGGDAGRGKRAPLWSVRRVKAASVNTNEQMHARVRSDEGVEGIRNDTETHEPNMGSLRASRHIWSPARGQNWIIQFTWYSCATLGTGYGQSTLVHAAIYEGGTAAKASVPDPWPARTGGGGRNMDEYVCGTASVSKPKGARP